MEQNMSSSGMGEVLLAEYRECLRKDIEGQLADLDREQKGKHPFGRKEETAMRQSCRYFLSILNDHSPRELTGIRDSRGNAVRDCDVITCDKMDSPCVVSYYPDKGMWYVSNGKGQCPLYELGLDDSFFEVVGNTLTTDEFKGLEPCIMEDFR